VDSRKWSRHRFVWSVVAATLAMLVVSAPPGEQPSRAGEVPRSPAVLVAQVVFEQEGAQGGRQVLMEVPGPATLKCGQDYRHTEPSEGTLGFRFQCLASYGVINWDFALSPAQRAQSPLGNIVNEAGMTWQRNGSGGGKNAPHPAEPNDYWFHGTLNPVTSGDTITYDDTYTYPNNFGGRTTLKVIGSIHLLGF
jgi:hypothetical protein